jgi:PAS domain S-box-containing protein
MVRLDAILKASPIAIVQIDRNGLVRLWSPAAERLFGWSTAEAVGLRYDELVVPEDARDDWRVLHEQALAGAVTERDAIRQRKDGSPIEVSLSVAPLRDERGEPTDVLAMIADLTERRQAEQALRKAHEELRINAAYVQALLDNIQDFMFIVSDEGRILYASPSLQRLTDRAPEELIGQHLFDYVHPDDLVKIKRIQQTLLTRPGEVAHTSGRFRRAEGEWLHLAIDAHFAPRLGGMVINARDETWRAQAESALRASEHKFRSIIEHVDDGVVLVDEAGSIVEWNRGMEHISGIRRDDALGRPIWDVQYDLTPAERRTPDYRAHLHELAQGAMLAGAPPVDAGRVEESELQRPDGTRRIVEAISATFPANQGFMVASILRDVTERQQAEERLRQQEARFRGLIEYASDLISILDPRTGEILYESPSAERILGYTPEEMLGQNVFTFVHPDDLADISEAFASLAAQPSQTVVAEARFRHKDGSWLHLEATGRHAPELGGIVVNSRDVTGQR